MKNLVNLILLSAFLLLPAAANAQYGPSLFISTTGNDNGGTNNCQNIAAPCRTFLQASNVTPVGLATVVHLADGQYTEQVNLSHYKWWQIYGNCTTEGAVIITSDWNRPAIWGQDHATLQIQCLDITTNGGGSTAIQTRQYAIADVVDKVRFGYFPGGTLFYVDDDSRINCAGANNKLILSNGGFGGGVSGAAQMMYVHDGSTATMPCTFTATAPYQFTNTSVVATAMGRAMFQNFVIGSGSQPVTVSSPGGYKVYLDQSRVDGIGNVPGSATGPNVINFSIAH